MYERYNLGTLIDVAAHGHRTLLVDCRDLENGRPWTGAAIEAQADAVARALGARGLARGARVAILSANRAEYLTAYFGAMRAGLVAVPVNVRFPAATVRYVLEDSGARFAFVDAERRGLCPDGLPAVCFDDAQAWRAFLDEGPFEPVRPHADEVAMFLYTSGSTGRPKGVPLTHRGHLWVVERRVQPGVDYAAERILVAAPLYHMNALALAKFAAAAGAPVVLLPQFTAASYIRAIERYRCTWLTSVPTMLALVTRETDLLARTDLSSVASVRMGSAPVTAKLLQRLREVFPTAAIQIAYGTTEAGPVVFAPHPDGLPTPDLSFGVAHPQVDLRLVADGDRDAREGVLEMRCPAVTPGYHGQPERTAAVMTDDGFYHTADVLRRDESGFYYFVGRDDDMFVCNGENVFPEEVERLIESHPAVAQACVVPVADEVRGHMPVAFVVTRSGEPLDEDAVRAHTIANGPAYQHPRRVFFTDELPLASTGKLDRKALAARAARATMPREC